MDLELFVIGLSVTEYLIHHVKIFDLCTYASPYVECIDRNLSKGLSHFFFQSGLVNPHRPISELPTPEL